jgi:arsenate reductase
MIMYRYKTCSTCIKALKWLEANGIAVEIKEIRETPPSMSELQSALQTHDGNLKRLLNTSGQDYRALGLKDTLPNMSSDEVLTLLTQNGNLVKRPLLVLDDTQAICGFNEDLYRTKLLSNRG